MFALGKSQIFFKFIDISFVKPQHLSHFQIESLNFFIFVGDSVLKVSFLPHQLLHVYVSVLKQLIVLDVSQRGFRSVAFDFFFSVGYHIFVFSLDSVMRSVHLL